MESSLRAGHMINKKIKKNRRYRGRVFYLCNAMTAVNNLLLTVAVVFSSSSGSSGIINSSCGKRISKGRKKMAMILKT